MEKGSRKDGSGGMQSVSEQVVVDPSEMGGGKDEKKFEEVSTGKCLGS